MHFGLFSGENMAKVDFKNREELKYTSRVFSKVLLVLMLVLVVYAFNFSASDNIKLQTDGSVILHGSMRTKGHGEVSSPYTFKASKGISYYFYDTVPGNVTHDTYLMINTYFGKTRVYHNDQVIGEFGVNKQLNNGKLVGNVRMMVPINSTMAGEDIMIEYTPYYSMEISYMAPMYGTEIALARYVLASNILELVLVLILLTCFLIASAMWIYLKASASKGDIRNMGYFALFCLSVAGWMFFASDLPQFITNASEAGALMRYTFMSIIPIAYCGFMERVLPSGKKSLEWFKTFGWLIPIFNVILFLVGLADPMDMLWLTKVYTIIVVVLVLLFAMSNFRRDLDSRIITTGLIILFLFIGIGLMLRHDSISESYVLSLMGLGLTINASFMLATIGRRLMVVMEDENDVFTYKTMAFADSLTGLENRASFEGFFDNLENNTAADGKTVILYMFDLNFLKVTNDKFGHKAGDQLLTGLAQCLKKTFERYGSVYRLGGDEFAAIVVGHADMALNLVEKLKHNIDTYNLNSQYKISTAVGYATRKFHKGDVDIYDRLFKDADDMMYANKVRMHKELGEEVRNKRS